MLNSLCHRCRCSLMVQVHDVLCKACCLTCLFAVRLGSQVAHSNVRKVFAIMACRYLQHAVNACSMLNYANLKDSMTYDCFRAGAAAMVLQAAQQRQQQQQQLQQTSDSEQVSAEDAVVDVAANASASSNGSKQKNGTSRNGFSRGKQSRKSKQRDTSKSK